MPDQADCAETWREVRRPDGVRCPECGSEEVQTRQKGYRDHLHRYHCETCCKWFIDTTGTPLEASNVELRRWVYLARGLDKGRPTGPIGEEIDVTPKTARRMAKTLHQALHEQRQSWLPALAGEVEADDVHVRGGQQGREVSEQKSRSEARTRDLSERGRGTYETGRPLMVSWIERGGEGRVFELRRSAGKKSLLSSALSHVEHGSQVDTSRVGRIPASRGSLRTPERQAQRRVRQRRGSALQHGRKRVVGVQSRRLSGGGGFEGSPGAICICTSPSTAFGAPTATRAGRSARRRWSVSFWLCERFRRGSLRPGRTCAIGPTCVILLESIPIILAFSFDGLF